MGKRETILATLTFILLFLHVRQPVLVRRLISWMEASAMHHQDCLSVAGCAGSMGEWVGRGLGFYLFCVYLLVSSATHDTVVWSWQRVSHVLSRWVGGDIGILVRWVRQSLIVMVVWGHLRDGWWQLGTHVLRVLLLLLLGLLLLLLKLLGLLLLLLLMGVEGTHAGQRDRAVAPCWTCAVWFGDELLSWSRVRVLRG